MGLKDILETKSTEARGESAAKPTLFRKLLLDKKASLDLAILAAEQNEVLKENPSASAMEQRRKSRERRNTERQRDRERV